MNSYSIFRADEQLGHSTISKTVFDYSMGLTLLFIFTPLILLITILVWINLGRPIFFVQERIGLNNQVFKIIKFRTMRLEEKSNGVELSDSERVSKFGIFLRASSLDELPELVNVIRGDMSLVGPRPLLTEYLQLYSSEQLQRHDLKPGITGWAQINGRNDISWEQKFVLDVWYVKNQSFLLDLYILFRTIGKILKRENINPKNKRQVEKFKG